MRCTICPPPAGTQRMVAPAWHSGEGLPQVSDERTIRQLKRSHVNGPGAPRRVSPLPGCVSSGKFLTVSVSVSLGTGMVVLLGPTSGAQCVDGRTEHSTWQRTHGPTKVSHYCGLPPSESAEGSRGEWGRGGGAAKTSPKAFLGCPRKPLERTEMCLFHFPL